MCKSDNIKLNVALMPVPEGTTPLAHLNSVKSEITGYKISGVEKSILGMEKTFKSALKNPNKQNLEVLIVAGPINPRTNERKLSVFSVK